MFCEERDQDLFGLEHDGLSLAGLGSRRDFRDLHVGGEEEGAHLLEVLEALPLLQLHLLALPEIARALQVTGEDETLYPPSTSTQLSTPSSHSGLSFKAITRAIPRMKRRRVVIAVSARPGVLRRLLPRAAERLHSIPPAYLTNALSSALLGSIQRGSGPGRQPRLRSSGRSTVLPSITATQRPRLAQAVPSIASLAHCGGRGAHAGRPWRRQRRGDLQQSLEPT